MGAVFASAARAPLTSLASVVEMTGDFALTLPVMLAVAIATALSRALSYGTIYTTKLLRRGTDIDRTTPWRALADLKIADAMRPFRLPLPVPPPAADGAGLGGTGTGWGRAARAGHLPGRPAGPVRHRIHRPGPAAAGGLRPRRPARAVRRRPPDTGLGHRPRRAAGHRPADQHRADPDRARPRPPAETRRPGIVPAAPADPAARIPAHRDHHPRRLARRRTQARRPQLAAGQHPSIVLRGHQLRPPRPDLTLAAGDRVSLLTGASDDAPSHPAHGRHAQPAKDGNGNHA